MTTKTRVSDRARTLADAVPDVVTGVRIIAFDIAGGTAREEVGTFESVQVTGREVRDPDGNVILRFFDECWFSIATGNGWYDFTIEAVSV